MNKVILMGRLTRDPDVRYSNGQGGDQLCIARQTLAVDRRFQRNGGDDQQNADEDLCIRAPVSAAGRDLFKLGLDIQDQ